MARTRYKLDRVAVEHREDRRATWEYVRRRVVGVESVYSVVDANYDRLNRWVFVVQVPKDGGSVIVRPQEIPGKGSWASISRSSLVFNPTKKATYRGWAYCKVALADPSGGQTKFFIRRGERSILPPWCRSLAHRMKLKRTVAPTRGTDSLHQVLLFRLRDHKRMIRAFFALKVWVLDRGYQLEP